MSNGKMQNGWPSRKNNYSRLMTSREADKRDAQVEVEAETGIDNSLEYIYDPHIYEVERCIYCRVNIYDNMIYGPYECIKDRPTVRYTTETEK